MTATVAFVILVGAVAVSRLVELRLSKRHQRDLAARGATPLPEPMFRAMVALHTAILAGAVLEVFVLRRPFVMAVAAPALALFALASGLRLWVISSLGVHWNVRVVRSTALGVVTSGPYRFVRHPNYVAVFVELLALPLVHGAYVTAVAGALLHAAILTRRIVLEESVLMADARYRLAFGTKPRFVPWPMS